MNRVTDIVVLFVFTMQLIGAVTDPEEHFQTFVALALYLITVKLMMGWD